MKISCITLAATVWSGDGIVAEKLKLREQPGWQSHEC
jgi:hypothetical protein